MQFQVPHKWDHADSARSLTNDQRRASLPKMKTAPPSPTRTPASKIAANCGKLRHLKENQRNLRLAANRDLIGFYWLLSAFIG
jgi:hypothetical protein